MGAPDVMACNASSDAPRTERGAMTIQKNSITPTEPTVTIQGVVFGKSIRSYYAILHVAMIDDEGAPTVTQQSNSDRCTYYAVVHVKFQDNPIHSATDMRSWCRRRCKLGDLVQFRGTWTTENDCRFVVCISSLGLHHADECMRVATVRHWSMPQCQEWQQKYRPKVLVSDEMKKKKPNKKQVKMEERQSSIKGETDCETLQRHGGASDNKRDQGDCVAEFLIQIMIESLQRSESQDGSNPSNDSEELRTKAIAALNQGTGVLDAAGGSGYVSMALGIKGIKSTVVDPRESVGKLPKRDRKVWHRLLCGMPTRNRDEDNEVLLCQPVVVPYDSVRAWFAKPPPQHVDTSFRHGDVESIPVCNEEHDLLRNCSAIVACHPDEATDAIVDLAIHQKIPFVVVPCCVFSRYFTYRRKPGTNLPVTTYEDLIDYLVSKNESNIQKTTLPFEGANVALWSVFK